MLTPEPQLGFLSCFLPLCQRCTVPSPTHILARYCSESMFITLCHSSHPLGIKRETLGKTENERLSGRGNRKKVGLIFCLGERTRQKKNCERENKTKNGRKGGRHEIYSMDESKGRQQKKKTVRKCK